MADEFDTTNAAEFPSPKGGYFDVAAEELGLSSLQDGGETLPPAPVRDFVIDPQPAAAQGDEADRTAKLRPVPAGGSDTASQPESSGVDAQAWTEVGEEAAPVAPAEPSAEGQALSESDNVPEEAPANKEAAGAQPSDDEFDEAVRSTRLAAAAAGKAKPKPKKKPRKPMRPGRVALIVVIVVVVAIVGLFSWVRWGHDDAADFVGTWRIAGTNATIVIDEDAIHINSEVGYRYTLDTSAKTLTYTFGGLEGSGRYHFSDGRDTLVIQEGDYSFVSTLGEDITRIGIELTSVITDQPAAQPSGEGVTVLNRVPKDPQASDQSADVQASSQAAAPAEQPAASSESAASAEAASEEEAAGDSFADEVGDVPMSETDDTQQDEADGEGYDEYSDDGDYDGGDEGGSDYSSDDEGDGE